ncbi:hypothetical protein N9782_00960 [Emcibacteraceae bacterium]|nr:hypothetical protein [Emcibacteraceae bacterium]
MSDLSILLGELTNILGNQNVITDEKECKFYSQDVFIESDHTAKAVIKPENITELSKAVAVVTNSGYAIFPRGGGHVIYKRLFTQPGKSDLP